MLGEPPEPPDRTGELPSLATQLADRCWGLTPGFHRFAFEHGNVLLTWCVGPVDAMLREQRFAADAIWLGAAETGAGHGFLNRDDHGAKTLARGCRRGTRVVGPHLPPPLRERLARGGFVVGHSGENFSAVFDPGWTPLARHDADRMQDRSSAWTDDAAQSPASVLVIGAGIAGAAVAASLARRGHAVCLLDAASEPAGGASAMPAGLFAPHLSADDNLLSRLSRAGIRQTLQFAHAHLEPGIDWQPGGVLEVRPDAMRALMMTARGRPTGASDWSETADDARKAAAGLNRATPAVWHRRAGWIKPRALVRALLALHERRIEWRGGVTVAHLVPNEAGWRAIDANGKRLAEARCVVIAAGDGSRALVPGGLPLRSIRGQLSWGSAQRLGGSSCATPPPPFPVNGDGSLLPCVPLEKSGDCWIVGATYERDPDAAGSPRVSAADHVANFERLRRLLPAAAEGLAPCFQNPTDGVRGWAGRRCVAPDRLPVVGAVAVEQRPGLWISGAMGSRGLTFALLCAELLAARIWREPLPVEAKLARALDADRFRSAAIRQ